MYPVGAGPKGLAVPMTITWHCSIDHGAMGTRGVQEAFWKEEAEMIGCRVTATHGTLG